MTRVCYREYYDKVIFIIEGHSGFGAVGADVVCAGISTLVYALINCLTDEESAERLKLRRKIIRDGYAFFEIEKFDFSRERVSGIIDGFVTGFLMLAENYPDHVRME